MTKSTTPKAKPRSAKERDEEKRKELYTLKNLQFKYAIRNLLGANKGAKMNAIVRKLIEEAELGNMAAIKILLERVDGVPKQEIELSNSESNPLTFIIASSQELIAKIKR